MRAAAVCIADSRVRQVSLFGSVARGEASPHSDIDLLILVDPAWGLRTLQIQKDLSGQARRAAGHACDLNFRTPAVWRQLSENVPISFEAAISSELLDLAKSDFDENEGSMDDMGDAFAVGPDELIAGEFRSVDQVMSNLKVSSDGISKDNHDLENSNPSSAEHHDHLQGRITNFLTSAHLGLEVSLKAFGMLTLNRPMPYSHNLEELLTRLPDSASKHVISRAIEDLRVEQDGEVLGWRQGHYANVRSKWAKYITPDNANQHIQSFLTCSQIAVDAAKDQSTSEVVLRTAKKLETMTAMVRSMNADAAYLIYGATPAVPAEPEPRRPLIKRLFSRKEQRQVERQDIQRTEGALAADGPQRITGLPSHDVLVASAPQPTTSRLCGKRTLFGRKCKNPHPGAGGVCSARHKH